MIQRLRCPISGDAAEVIFARPYSVPALRYFARRAKAEDELTGRDFEVRYSATSKLHFQTWVMADDEVAQLYSPTMTSDFIFGQIAAEKLHSFAHVAEEILVMRQMVRMKTPVVLDFGCGWGKWGTMALAFGCRVYGFDVNRDAVAFCGGRGITMISLQDLPALNFDFINVDQVMEHVSDPLGITRLLAGSLKPGGFIKISTPADERLPYLLRRGQQFGDDSVLEPDRIASLTPLEHVNLFTNFALRLLGERAGLRPVPLPFFKLLGAGQLWNLPRQINRNLLTPWKRWRIRGPYVWLQKAVKV